MCGLVGVMGDISFQEQSAFEELLFIDTLRGKDSTGVFHVTHTGAVEMHKKALAGPDFLQTTKGKEICNNYGRVLAGHNRAATKGGVNDMNAHPFDFPTLIGMHNGTLTSRWQLDDYRMFDVDSENLFHHIDVNGLQSALDKSAGAYALVWYDKDNHQMKFIRNDQRPLHFALSADGGTLFWASEYTQLSHILTRNSIAYESIFMLKEHTLVTVDVAATEGGTLKISTEEVVPEKKAYGGGSKVTYLPKKKKVAEAIQQEEANNDTELYKVGERVEFFLLCQRTNKEGAEYYFGNTADQYCCPVHLFKNTCQIPKEELGGLTRFEGIISKKVSGALRISPHSVVEIIDEEAEEPEVFIGYEGRELTREGYELLLKRNCAWCGNPSQVGDVVDWISEEDHVCQDCMCDETYQMTMHANNNYH